MSFTLVPVVGELVNPDGSAPSGAMTLTLTDTEGNPKSMKDTGTDEIVLPQPIQAVVSSGKVLAQQPGIGGYGPLELYAVDDPTTTPTGLVYTVHEELSAGNVPDWQLTVSHTDASVDIGSQRPAG